MTVYTPSDPELQPYTQSNNLANDVTVTINVLTDRFNERAATFTQNSSQTYSQRVYYNLDTEEFLNLKVGSSGRLNVTLSCSDDATSTTMFDLNSYGTYVMPTWVSLDEGRQQIVYNGPNVTGEHKFSIDTMVTNWPSERQKIVHLNFTECTLDN